MRVCILGAGGLGSVIGGYLAETGVEVVLVARSAHAEAIRAQGLRIEGRRGERLIRRHLTAVTHADQASGDFDVLILAVKHKDTLSALASAEALRPRVACVCSVQNGVIKEDLLADWAGADKVLGVSIVEGGTLLAPGRVHNHLTALTTFYCGEIDGRISPRAQQLAAAFSAADLPARAVDCVRQVIWEKLALVCTVSSFSVSSLIGRPEWVLADGLSQPEGAAHYAAVARECIAVYRAMGWEPQDFYAPSSRLRELGAAPDLAAAAAIMLAQGRKLVESGFRGRSSMHEDALHGRRTEADLIIKPMIDKAQELGIAVPTLQACYRIVSLLDRYAQS